MHIVTHDHALPDTLLAIDNTQDVLALADTLARTPQVLLQFPKWTDGRAYSQARLLRSRLRYGGEIWAGGDVLLDMLPLLQRCGFDGARLAAGQDAAAASEAISHFSGFGALYQADLVSKLPHYAQPARVQR